MADQPISIDAQEDRYLIRKGGAFYRPNAEGYTNVKAEAGRYTLAEAISYSHPNGPDGPRDGIDYMLAGEPAAPCLASVSSASANETEREDAQIAMGLIVDATTLEEAQSIAAAFLGGAQ